MTATSHQHIPDEAERAQLRQVAENLRRRRAVINRQLAIFGVAHAPPHLLLEKEDLDTQLRELAQQLRESTTPESNPYRGLAAFSAEHAHLFFGRDVVLGQMLERTQRTSFLSVLGASGSGKSSLVRAGLLPTMQARNQQAAPWPVVVFTPGQRPLNALAAAFAPLVQPLGLNAFELQRNLAEKSDSLLFLGDLLLKNAPDARMVIVVDQAEELWTMRPDDTQQEAEYRAQQYDPLINLLLAPVVKNDMRTLMVLTMRTDFLHHAAEQPQLASAITNNMFLVGGMQREELRATIEGPAEVVNCQLEAGLTDTLLNEVAGSPAALPLLEYTLALLWEGRTEQNMLTWQQYRAIGEVQGALAQHADEVIAHCSLTEQQQLRRLLPRLIRVEDRAITTRQRCRLLDFVGDTTSAEDVQKLLEPLIEARLLTIDSTTSGETTVEITHEALIHAWPNLQQWVAEATDDVHWHERLTQATTEWQSQNNHPTFLWGGARLVLLQEWIDKHTSTLSLFEQEFVSASKRHEQAQLNAEIEIRDTQIRLQRSAQNRLRMLVAVLGCITLLALGILGYPWVLRAQARGQVVPIPGGTTVLGSNDPNADTDEQPLWQAEVAGFQIGKYEVANWQYKLCIQVNSCSPPITNPLSVDDPAQAQYPVVGVSLYQANQYCEWVGMRLPSELEWNLAARGDGSSMWPWGDQPISATYANIDPEFSGENHLLPVDSLPDGASQQGVFNLVGNAWEWTSSTSSDYNAYDPTAIWAPGSSAEIAVMRGGAFDEAITRPSQRNIAMISLAQPNYGIRCVAGQ